MEPDPDVLEMVRRQLDRDPPPSTEALYGRAARINEEIYQLSLRQFNATYVLRVKRERKREDGERKREDGGQSGSASGGATSGRSNDDAEGPESPRPGGFLEALEEEEAEEPEDDVSESGSKAVAETPLRDRVRRVLWSFAREVASLTGADGAVVAVERVDDYVDELVAANEARGRPTGAS